MTTADITGGGAVGSSTRTSRAGKPSWVSALHIAGSQETTAVWLTWPETQAAAIWSVRAWAGVRAGVWLPVPVAQPVMYLATATPKDPAAMRTSAAAIAPVRAPGRRPPGLPAAARPVTGATAAGRG